jgi:ankyrin repeat protein
MTVDEYDDTPLHSACLEAHTNIIKLLLKKGANVNVVTKGGNTQLHFACLMGNQVVDETLLKNSADINVSNEDDRSPLHLASEAGHTEIRNLLENLPS